MKKSFLKITLSPFIAFILFAVLIQDKDIIRSWIIPRTFSQTEPLFDYQWDRNQDRLDSCILYSKSAFISKGGSS